ncbi:rotatin [Synchiropus splendidus]|uniref:rotatin n=1 Tax=Synchiropus splendidus TaxID=270530 RepID=UPI00237E7683|nr:rotatin [Synchiropus splendidus]
MDLAPVIKKLGHSLVEIRVRALKNILSKLDHSLITVPDIVQERKLFVCLLEWFNFPEVPMQEEVLELLSTLSKHPSAAQMLRDVDAVDFLTQLSSNLEPRLQPVIDSTLDQLFQLPELFPPHGATPFHGLPAVSATDTNAEDQFPSGGYFNKIISGQTDLPPGRIAVHQSVWCLRFSVFPWLTLTNTDRHILSSNENSLRSSNPNLVWTTCELLCDVIMKDFPAEIFLQRPSIVQCLFSLLRHGLENGEPTYLHLQAISCLRQLCAGLRQRLRFHQDPSFHSTKHDPVSQNSSLCQSQDVRGTRRSQTSSPGAACSPRPSVVGRTSQRARGDGQDGDAGSSSSQRGGTSVQAVIDRPSSPADVFHLEIPDLGVEDVSELQLQQLTLPQFAVATMEHALPLLKTDGTHVLRRVLELLCDSIILLGNSVSAMVWDDRSLVGMELKGKLQACLEQLGDILSHHQSHTADVSGGSQIHHRIAYMCTAVLTIKLLQIILPAEKASDSLPEKTATAIFHLCLDKSLGSLLPSIQETAVAYLEQVNIDGHDLYKRVNCAALCMESTCIFLKELQAEGPKNWLELLELADRAIDGLPFHHHLPIVKDCVRLCSDLWKMDQSCSVLQMQSQNHILKLLSHPLPAVKTEAYTCMLNLVKDCLGIHNVSRLEPCVLSEVNFLLHHKVLYEISAFGLQDSCEMVNTAAKDIMLFLLKGQLIMTTSTWNRFTEALYPVIPVLQGHASTEDSLGNCVLLISSPSDMVGDNMFPGTAKLRAGLRLLFSKRPNVRSAAVPHILPHLTSDDEASRPDLNHSTISFLPNLFCLRVPLDVKLDTSKKSVLKVESVKKLFCILSSETVDISLRRSSAEQLSLVLQDTTMHPVLKSLGVAEKAISFIDDSVNGSRSMDCMLEPCICILRKLVYADPALRHSLALRNPLLLQLLRASFILKEIKSSGSDIAVLMCLLLFDEIADINMWSDKCSGNPTSTFSLPLSVSRRYNIPFQAASHHAVSPYCCILAPSSDLLTLAPARHALQVAWNVAWHSGMDNLLDKLPSSHDAEEFHADLQLSEAQVLSLRAIHPPAALQDCVQTIVTAEGHSSVTSALSRLNLYLLIDRLALPHVPTFSYRGTLHSLTWRAAVARFLQVHPASVEDQRLLVAIVGFLNSHFKLTHTKCTSDAEDDNLRWILEHLLNKEHVSLLDLFLGVEKDQSARSQEELKHHVGQKLQRELTCLFNQILLRLTHTTDRISLALAGPFKSQLAMRLLQSLRVSDAPRFYGLPSLERILQGMVSLTAQPGWSLHCPDQDSNSLCSMFLSGLLEVISSFYVEWGGNSLSYMGKGVTKNAVICLLHLSHEMIAHNKTKDLITKWSLGNETATEEASVTQSDLAWLVPLWVDRDPEVRFASLGLGAALSSVPGGREALCGSCQNISGGLWGMLLNILLDQQESSMVRREAAFILQNLLVMAMPANADEAKDSDWQHPCVHDEVSGVSLVGLPALQALLYHCNYFQHVAVCTSTCFRGRCMFQLEPSVNGGHHPPCENTLDSLVGWTPPAPPDSLSRPASSISTSSTVIRGSRSQTPAAISPLNIPDSNRLTAQGQSETDTSDSVTSQDSRQCELSSIDTVVRATPDLLCAHCALLANLLAILPDFTLAAMKENQLLHRLASLVDTRLIEKCLGELRDPHILPGDHEDIKCQVISLLQFQSSFAKLLQSCVHVSPDVMGQLDKDLKHLLDAVIASLMLDSKGLDASIHNTVCVCWADMFMLLATVVKRDSAAVYPSVSAALRRRWQTFAETLSVCLREKPHDLVLLKAALLFLSSIFTEEAKRRGPEVASGSSNSSGLSDIVNSPEAGQLCQLLMENFERASPQEPLKKLAARALMTLLACSPNAQSHAAKAGLIDSCVEQLKQTHSQLQMTSGRAGKVSLRKKDESYLKEVKLTVEILQSALYCSDECKLVARDARLTASLHALWVWLTLDDPTMEAVLELLCVYTANCTAACSSLCGLGPGGEAGLKTPSGTSLMHSVMRLVTAVAPDNSTIQKLGFSLLTNLAISRDCRGVLQKNNFIHSFLSLPVPKTGGGKASQALVGLWLKLLLSVSFAEDGQQSILKVTGMLELLTDLAQHRQHALLTLHNLCFCPANKPHIVSNDKAVKVFLCCLGSQDVETRCIGASALWALLHNNQKAKTTLKCPSVRLKIDEARSNFKKESRNKEEPMSAHLSKCLDNLTQLLNH